MKFINNKNIKLEPNGKYYALLIGNSKYDNWDNLVSPENDVREIKKVLDQSYKFEKIIHVDNGTKKEILTALEELSLITAQEFTSMSDEERQNVISQAKEFIRLGKLN